MVNILNLLKSEALNGFTEVKFLLIICYISDFKNGL